MGLDLSTLQRVLSVYAVVDPFRRWRIIKEISNLKNVYFQLPHIQVVLFTHMCISRFYRNWKYVSESDIFPFFGEL